MTPTPAYLSAALALLGLMAYAVLAGADFGGGVWDLFATGPRKGAQRHAIAHAIGPVWEANHVWLIFVLVVLFTCFPTGYAALMNALFLPLHLVLGGIMLRGAAFVFRHYGPPPEKDLALLAPPTTGESQTSSAISHHNAWGAVFGVASLVSPLLLGWSFGVATAGEIHISETLQTTTTLHPLSLYPLFCAILALSTCAYLAAVYLMVETQGDLRGDFRQRAILSGTLTAALAVLTLISARTDAQWLWHQLLAPRALPVLLAGGLAFSASAAAVFTCHPRIARACAIAQTVLMLLGWGLAHRDYLLYPDMPLTRAMAPGSTLIFMLFAVPLGMLLLAPSLWLLFKVFKSSGVAPQQVEGGR